jgi:hypothetical protein
LFTDDETTSATCEQFLPHRARSGLLFVVTVRCQLTLKRWVEGEWEDCDFVRLVGCFTQQSNFACPAIRMGSHAGDRRIK